MNNQLECPDCTVHTATDASGYVAAAIQSCPRHKRDHVRAMLDARAANPEIDAVHRMMEAHRARAKGRS